METIKYLIAKGADPNCVDKKGKTAQLGCFGVRAKGSMFSHLVLALPLGGGGGIRSKNTKHASRSTKHLFTTLDMPAKPADYREYCIQGSTGSVQIGLSYTISKLSSFEA